MTGTTLRSGFVCLVGRPNVGKSTLLNALVGRPVSITARKPQTTRNRIVGVKHGPGYQVVLVDTPGIHQAAAPLNVRMVRYATAALAEADIVLVIVEPGPEPTQEDHLVLERVREAAPPALLLINKIDIASEATILRSLQTYGALGMFEEVVPVSAVTGKGLKRLERLIVARLRPGPPYFEPEQATDQSETMIIAELVRQELFRRTHQEVPYKSAVRVEHLEDKPGRLVIDARIFVERDSQKGIVIGKGGRMLKAIGTAARAKIEALLGVRVYLGLQVSVLAGWSENPRYLAELGYPES
ncbi:MAG: GTPase Era [SAR324 cluster bacterium]|nr:GTPase Era [SAR324 cluster bacterium]